MNKYACDMKRSCRQCWHPTGHETGSAQCHIICSRHPHRLC